MKRLLLIGLFLLTSCQSATPEPSPVPQATSTRFVPTPVPATVTPTVTPLPTVTATLPPPERYFTEEFDGALTYWSTLYASGDTSRVETLNQDGKLTFELYSSNAWLYAIYGPYEYETVHLEASVESSGSDTNYMGLICNYTELNGWFEFNISSDGSYNVLYGQWLGEGIADYMPVVEGDSEYVNLGSTTNVIGLDCLDGTLQLYVNEKLFRNIDVSRFELSEGKVGLAVASFNEAPVILAFDWVTVSEP